MAERAFQGSGISSRRIDHRFQTLRAVHMPTRKDRAGKCDFRHADHTSKIGFLNEKRRGTANEKKLTNLRATSIKKKKRMHHTKELRSISCTTLFLHREELEYRTLRFLEPSFEDQLATNPKDCGPKCESGIERVPRSSSDRRAASSKASESQHSRAAAG